MVPVVFTFYIQGVLKLKKNNSGAKRLTTYWVFASYTLAFGGSTVVKVARSIPAGVSGFFIDIKSFRSHYGPGVDSASNRNEYQEYFLGVKGVRCVTLTTLPPSCAVVMKSGNLNFLETCGPLQA